MLEDWNISKNKVHVVVRDNGPNIVRGVNEAGLHGIGCYIHSLQLVIVDALKFQEGVVDVLSKCRSIVSHVNRAPSIAHRFAQLQLRHGPAKVLVQDVMTRWNTSFYMLERFQELKQYVLVLQSEVDFKETLTASDWSTISYLITLLKPFEAVTRTFSSNCLLSSEIIPSIRSLKLLLQQPGRLHAGVETTKARIVQNMDERFKDDTYENNPILTFATFLDPRYKLAPLSTPERQQQVKATLFDYLNEATKEDSELATLSTAPADTDPTSEAADNSEAGLLSYDEVLSSFATSHQQSSLQPSLVSAVHEAEVNFYLKESNLKVFKDIEKSERNDPLVWWNMNRNRFPNLAVHVPKYLSSPATSVYSERVFSEAGNVYEAKRNRLIPDTAGKLTFLKHNLRILDFQYENSDGEDY